MEGGGGGRSTRGASWVFWCVCVYICVCEVRAGLCIVYARPELGLLVCVCMREAQAGLCMCIRGASMDCAWVCEARAGLCMCMPGASWSVCAYARRKLDCVCVYAPPLDLCPTHSQHVPSLPSPGAVEMRMMARLTPLGGIYREYEYIAPVL